MIAPLTTLALGALKTLLLLGAAAAGTALLRRRPARVRVVVWGTALAGCLLIPVVAPLLPPIEVPVVPARRQSPAAMAGTAERRDPTSAASLALDLPHGSPAGEAAPLRTVGAAPDLTPWAFAVWAAGACAVLSRLTAGLARSQRIVRRSDPILSDDWRRDLTWALRRVGVRRPVRLLVSSEVDVPATVGVLRPAVLVPLSARAWPVERRRAVLLHELIHVHRFDWPLRVVARLTRGLYWFNPVAWWAIRRLDLDQELACDEEVVALGVRPSAYALHLLGIARTLTNQPAPALSQLEMARACQLEERIMTILEHATPRRVGSRALVPAAVLIAALVPAIAAVAPTDAPTAPVAPAAQRAPAAPAAPADPGERTRPAAAPDVGEIVASISRLEEQMQPHLARIEEIEVAMAPELERISDLDLEIEREALADIEAAMEPYLERIRAIELDMAPASAEMERIGERLEGLELHIDDGTLADIERQIREQIEPLHEELDRLHASMAPYHEQIEAIHEQMEPLHLQLEKLHAELRPSHQELEQIHESLEPLHEQMAEIQRSIEPFQAEMAELGRQLEAAVAADVVDVLRQHLGAVVGPQAPFAEAADRLIEDAHIDVRDDVLRVRASAAESRQILTDLLAPHRLGSQSAFDDAVAAAADAVANLKIRTR